jgi:hypothetical protein
VQVHASYVAGVRTFLADGVTSGQPESLLTSIPQLCWQQRRTTQTKSIDIPPLIIEFSSKCIDFRSGDLENIFSTDFGLPNPPDAVRVANLFYRGGRTPRPPLRRDRGSCRWVTTQHGCRQITCAHQTMNTILPRTSCMANSKARLDQILRD